MIKVPSRTICHFYDLKMLVYKYCNNNCLDTITYQDMETLQLKLLVIWKMSHNDIDNNSINDIDNK